MRNIDDGGKKKKKEKKEKRKKEEKIMTFLVATTSLPAVDRPNADRWNAARSCQHVLFHQPHRTLSVVEVYHINLITVINPPMNLIPGPKI